MNQKSMTGKTMADQTPTLCPFLWLNDQLHRADEPAIMTSDRGLLLGDGLFETMQLRDGHAPLLEHHLARLEEGCVLLRIPCPSREQIRHALAALMAANGLTHGSARLTLTRGPGPRGLAPPATPRPTLLLTTAAPAPPSHAPARPVRLHVSQQRRDSQAVLNRVKSLNALPAILARLEAQEHGADDALILNEAGNITEATAASFLALMEGRLVTPPLEAGLLPGISRARLLAERLCQEQTLTEADLPHMEGAWLVTALSLVPVSRINAHVNGQGTAQLTGNRRNAMEDHMIPHHIPDQPEHTAELRHFLYDNPS